MTRPPASFHHCTAQSGFSLIELMLALTLSLFLLIGLIQVFLGNRMSYRMHEGSARIQENGRFAMEILGRQIRMAGYRAQPLAGAPLDAVDGRNDVAGGGRSEVMADTDKLILRYQGAADGRTVDCAGNSVDPDDNVTAVFLVNEDRSLRCSVNPADVDNARGQPLLNGIGDMQLMFGERVTDHSTSPATHSYRYVTANNVNNWRNVIAVRVELTVDSIDPVDPGLPDGRLAKPFTSNFTIRNRI